MGISTAIVGAAGYTGIELVRHVLLNHSFSLKVCTSSEYEGCLVTDVFQELEGHYDLRFTAPDDLAVYDCDMVFLCVPHTAALPLVPKLMEGSGAIVDLSADFRFKDPAIYEKWYNTKHTCPELLDQAILGLPDIYHHEMKEFFKKDHFSTSILVSCPGCYPTATSLAAIPALRSGLINKDIPLVVDAISGVTGAGRTPTDRTHFCSANENLQAYSVGNHRHLPEIEQLLGMEGKVVFTPHLAPLNRGLLSTVTMFLNPDVEVDHEIITEIYRKFYQERHTVRILEEGKNVQTAPVMFTNNAHIGLTIDKRNRTLVAVCAIDNLARGSAGQAMECANLIWNLPETQGLYEGSVPI